MKRWTRAVAVLSLGLAAGTGAALTAGAMLWRRRTRQAFARLEDAAARLPSYEFSPEELALLPAPVQRYFAFALTPGQSIIRRAMLVQQGVFRMGGTDAHWRPFTSEQRFTARPPGFVWDARIHAAPLTSVRVRDSYVAGAGAMEASLASLIPVMEQRGTPELAAGALHRYLAEAVWLPTALLPGQGVEWAAIDDASARATLTDGAVSVSLVFHFGDFGEIVRAYTPERYRDVAGASIPTPWTCTYSDYMLVDGMRIPAKGKAAWILPEGTLSYCVLRLREIKFDAKPRTGARAFVRGLIGLQDVLHHAPRCCCHKASLEVSSPIAPLEGSLRGER